VVRMTRVANCSEMSGVLRFKSPDISEQLPAVVPPGSFFLLEQRSCRTEPVEDGIRMVEGGGRWRATG
jgi:hypothetical protein